MIKPQIAKTRETRIPQNTETHIAPPPKPVNVGPSLVRIGLWDILSVLYLQ